MNDVTIPRLFLTAFGLGLLRPASGTWGSLPPVVLVLAMALIGVPQWQIDATLVLMAFTFSLACVRFGAWAERRWGRKDPSEVVADEVAGQSIALLLLPWQGEWLHDSALAATAFFAFRLFDIVKPPPANRMQRLPHGWGILVDDLFAGLYALIVAHAVAWLLLPVVLNT